MITSLRVSVVNINEVFRLLILYKSCILQVEIRLLASETYECRIVVMALNAGRLPFPKIQLRSRMVESSLLDEVVWFSVPSSIFVLVRFLPFHQYGMLVNLNSVV